MVGKTYVLMKISNKKYIHDKQDKINECSEPTKAT